MKYDCIFRHNDYLVVQVNPQLQLDWIDRGREGDFPFSAAQRIWRRWHCSVINPYGSGDGDCPYTIVQCTDAYRDAMLDILGRSPENFVAYIKPVARSRGLTRSENRPLRRDVSSRTDGLSERTAGLRTGSRARPVDDLARRGPAAAVPGVAVPPQRGVRRTPAGFSTAGDVLREDDLRSRPRPRGRHEGQKGDHYDGDGCVDL